MSIPKYLAHYLNKCNQLEIFAQKIRQNIAANVYFQVISVFDRFDKYKKGYLIPSDLSQFMLENQIYPSQTQLYLVFKDFDKEKVGMITLDRFQEEILPRENKKLKKDALARKPYHPDQRLSIDLEFLIGRYFDAKIQAIKQLNKIRKDIQSVKIYSTEQAFLLLDYRKIGYISRIQEIDRFLRNNGSSLSHQDLVRIYRTLNMNQDGQITYEIFQEHLDPFKKEFYLAYQESALEKHKLIDYYLLKRSRVQQNILENSRRKVELTNNILDLRQSNRKLESIIRQQDYLLQPNLYTSKNYYYDIPY